MELVPSEPALCTDLYELTMAAAYWQADVTHEAAFEMFVRHLPDDRPFMLAAGLEQALDYLQKLRFTGEQIDYLRGLNAFAPVEDGFFDYLREFRFTGSALAVPEGTPVFPDEPFVRVEGPMIEAQIVETFLLSAINFQTLIASKAARVAQAADLDGRHRPVAEFGARRAHGFGAAVQAARASYIGGCDASSNTEAGYMTGMPVSGTKAHSFVMNFDQEADAFRAYYDCFGEQSIMLIDTYDTVEGARKAVEVAPDMRGVRLDSGDLLELSREVREILDEGGCEDAIIVASGNLDEYKIAELVREGAPIDAFGVGTSLVTSDDDPALGGVYKLVSVRQDGEWRPRMKLSASKTTWPGRKEIFRFRDPKTGRFVRDVLGCADEPTPDGAERVLTQVVRDGEPVGERPDLETIRDRARAELARLPDDVTRMENPRTYPVDISKALQERFERISAELEERQ
jgi:nicotinate phosphoribosyltransferase